MIGLLKTETLSSFYTLYWKSKKKDILVLSGFPFWIGQFPAKYLYTDRKLKNILVSTLCSICSVIPELSASNSNRNFFNSVSIFRTSFWNWHGELTERISHCAIKFFHNFFFICTERQSLLIFLWMKTVDSQPKYLHQFWVLCPFIEFTHMILLAIVEERFANILKRFEDILRPLIQPFDRY